jgi:hypothetical protein
MSFDKKTWQKKYNKEYHKGLRRRDPNRKRFDNKTWEREYAREYRKGKRRRGPDQKPLIYKDPRPPNSRHRHTGMTSEQYSAQFLKQEGRCDLCGRPTVPGERLVSDHNHETGENRGLIHVRCNTGIGMFKDDPELLAKAILYLEKYK